MQQRSVPGGKVYVGKMQRNTHSEDGNPQIGEVVHAEVSFHFVWDFIAHVFFYLVFFSLPVTQRTEVQRAYLRTRLAGKWQNTVVKA